MKRFTLTSILAAAAIMAFAGPLGDTAARLQTLPSAKTEEIQPNHVREIPVESSIKIEISADAAAPLIAALPAEMKFADIDRGTVTLYCYADDNADPAEMLCIKSESGVPTLTVFYITGSPVMIEIARDQAMSAGKR